MANIQHPLSSLDPSPPVQAFMTMPWDLDRYFRKNTKPPTDAMLPLLEDGSNPSLPSYLFTVSRDTFGLILDHLTKKDAFRLAQTCTAFARHPLVCKAVFQEPISITDLESWYQRLYSSSMDRARIMGPPVTWGINACSGVFVRRMAIPEWASKQDIHHLTTCCTNLHTVDFRDIFKSQPDAVGRGVDEDSNSDSDLGSDLVWNVDEVQDGLDYWPPMFNRCPALFKNLKSVHLPYGSWRSVYSRGKTLPQLRSAHLPKILRLANHLRSLEITCQQDSRTNISSEFRRKTSANLLQEILGIVSRELTTLTLHKSQSTIDNLDGFLQALGVFPKLRTVKLSLHCDLKSFEMDLQPYAFPNHTTVNHTMNTINLLLYGRFENYESRMTTRLQYLLTLKKINDRARFWLVSTDRGEDYLSTPRNYYGLRHTEVVHGPRDHLWNPVWTWNDRLNWVRCHREHPLIEVLDIEKCRALFEELSKASIPVSLQLGPCNNSSGGLFTEPRNSRGSDDLGEHPRQHFSQRRVLIATTPDDPSTCHSKTSAIDCQAIRLVSVHVAGTNRNPNYRLDNSPFMGSALWDRPMLNSLQELRGHTSESSQRPCYIPENEMPDPIWRLNEIGDLVDDLRIHWQRGFAHSYTELHGSCLQNPTWAVWSKILHVCKMHLRHRFWREAEYTIPLFRRIRVDFPRLTRLSLYIPAALYPDHDQTFIDHVLPGTGWTVKHYSSVIGDPASSVDDFDKNCLKLADDMCPFIWRCFTRPTPTDDPAAVIVHDDKWHVTKRPLFDLDNEFKSMNQLLTEPLWRNYTEGNDWRRMWDPQITDIRPATIPRPHECRLTPSARFVRNHR